MSFKKALVAEFAGTALLLAAVVGSGIMAERLSAGNAAIALLANTLATGGALAAIILAFAPVSGAHLNPVVSVTDAWRGGIGWREVPGYVAAQTCGAIAGVGTANLMFGLPLFSASRHVRTGAPLWLGEVVATFGLMAVIWGCARSRPGATPFAVGAFIVGAYWFTSSTSFANPAVTLARSLSDTFSGIRPIDVVPFILAQFAGAGAATALFIWFGMPEKITSAPRDGSSAQRIPELRKT